MFTLGDELFYFFTDAAFNLLRTSPETLSSGAYNLVLSVLHNYMYASAAVILNLMFYAGLCKQLSNFRQNMTLEVCIELFFRVIGANLLLYYGTNILKSLLNTAYTWVDDLCGITGWGSGILFTSNLSISSIISSMGWQLILGLVYIVTAISSGAIIFITIFSRFFNVYLLLVMYPFAVSTIPGMPGISNSFGAYVKTFVEKVFSIVLLYVAFLISALLVNTSANIFDSSILGSFDTLSTEIQNMLYMVAIAAGVRGTDALMRRALGL